MCSGDILEDFFNNQLGLPKEKPLSTESVAMTLSEKSNPGIPVPSSHTVYNPSTTNVIGPSSAPKAKLNPKLTAFLKQCANNNVHISVRTSVSLDVRPGSAVLKQNSNSHSTPVRGSHSKVSAGIKASLTPKNHPPIIAACPNPAAAVWCPTVRFQQLPEPIREKIWNFARPSLRTIELQISKDGHNIYSSAKIPNLLHVSQESREVALKWYKLAFAPTGFKPRVFFDFYSDRIYTHCNGCIGFNCNHKKTHTQDHSLVTGLVYQAPLSSSPFLKIHQLFPSACSVMLIRGRSSVIRGEIQRSDIRGASERFEWQHGTLAETCDKEMETKPPRDVLRSFVKRSHRAIIPQVQESVPVPIKTGLWTCCC